MAGPSTPPIGPSEERLLKVGDRIDVRLPGSGASGFQWSARGSSEQLVIGERQYREPQGGERKTGESLDEVFPLTAVAPGLVTVTFELARPWQRDKVAETRVLNVYIEPFLRLF
jgi:predicted secreted protein